MRSGLAGRPVPLGKSSAQRSSISSHGMVAARFIHRLSRFVFRFAKFQVMDSKKISDTHTGSSQKNGGILQS